MLSLPGVGVFTLVMSKLVFTRESFMRFAFSSEMDGEDISVCCFTEVDRGVDINGLIIGLNDFLKPFNDISVDGEYSTELCFTTRPGNVVWYMSPDFSSGWVLVRGGVSLTFNSEHKNLGQVVGRICGGITFDSEDGEFNLSWSPEGVVVDGSAVLTLSGFEFWVKDKIDISIPSLIGRFTIDTVEGTGSLVLLLSRSSVSLAVDTSIDIEGLMDITVQANIVADFDMSVSGYVSLSWDESGLDISSASVGVGYSGSTTISGLNVVYADVLSVSASRIFLSGDFSFSLSFTALNFVFDASGVTLVVNGFDIALGGLVCSFSSLSLSGSADIIFNNNWMLMFDVAGSVGLTNFVMSMPMVISISFSVDLSAAGILYFNVDESYKSLGLHIEDPVVINNFFVNLNNALIVFWDVLHIDVDVDASVVMDAGSGDIRSLSVDAGVNSIVFSGFELFLDESFGGLGFSVDGAFNLVAAGPLLVRARVVGGSADISLVLGSGSLDVVDLFVGVDDRAGTKVEASWDSLHMVASLTFEIKLNKISKDILVTTSGSGAITLDDLEVIGGGNLADIYLGYFNLDLGSLSASISLNANGDEIVFNSSFLNQ